MCVCARLPRSYCLHATNPTLSSYQRATRSIGAASNHRPVQTLAFLTSHVYSSSSKRAALVFAARLWLSNVELKCLRLAKEQFYVKRAIETKLQALYEDAARPRKVHLNNKCLLQHQSPLNLYANDCQQLPNSSSPFKLNRASLLLHPARHSDYILDRLDLYFT